MAALLRVLGEKLKPAMNNPTLGAVQYIRPEMMLNWFPTHWSPRKAASRAQSRTTDHS